ncbi:MAG TPA: hypothetical protein VEQ11_02275 [Chloroflexota bacterium]|nr:hypothetical protein [Chloroflexota bacterium]
MARRSVSWVVLAAALALVGCSPARDRFSQFLGQPSAAATPARLAYVAEDNHVYTVALEGGDPLRADSIPGEQPVAGEVRISRWPTWTSDGARLAFMRLRSGEGDEPANAAIWTTAPDGSDLHKIWESQDLAPIYMAWSPDASALALLVQNNDTLALQLLDPAGARPPRTVAEGGPLYFSWSPDAAELLIHVGGDHRSNQKAELSVLRPGPNDERRSLASPPADFRAPAWSPDGTRLAYIAEAQDKSAVLIVSNAGGGESVRLAPLGDEAAFLWSPNGDYLAFGSRSPTERIFYQGLEVVKSDGSGRAQITQEAVMAFFWSPDGKKLAFASIDRQAQALAWFVSDSTGKSRKQVGTFLPSQDQIRHFAFFDQYAQSHALWSPDSRYLVYTGLPAGARADPTAARRSRVFVVPADGSAEAKAIVDGNLAIWPAHTARGR